MMKRIKAFTLIETIFTIVIFCVGILTVLFWLSQTLRNKDYANTQIKSAFFAREWIELMFNLRDANYHKKLPWNCVFQWKSKSFDADLECKDKFEPWDILKVSIWSWNEYVHIENWNPINDFETAFDDYQIYSHTWTSYWFVYDYKDDGEPTWFARYIVIDTVTWVNKNDKLLKIESHVLYQSYGNIYWKLWI
jgi:hypothetical protein